MIFIVIMRLAECEICRWQFYLGPEETADTCPHCGSKEWMYGPEGLDSRYIRMKIKTAARKLNPGAKSKKRQDQGKAQWQKFGPKPIEDELQQTDN